MQPSQNCGEVSQNRKQTTDFKRIKEPNREASQN
jgi:hypothetical protein